MLLVPVTTCPDSGAPTPLYLQLLGSVLKCMVDSLELPGKGSPTQSFQMNQNGLQQMAFRQRVSGGTSASTSSV